MGADQPRRRSSPVEALRTLGRFIEIVAIALAALVRHRLGRQPAPEIVHRAVLRLGPTFIKFGQVASTRPDLIPAAISERLQTLQEAVPSFPFAQVRQVIEAELGRTLEDAFRHFGEEPVAAASLSQVHFAELPDGTPVAVKVQRPGIRAVIERDLAILRRLAGCGALLLRSVRRLRPKMVIDEFGRWTLKELDFAVEGHNLDEFAENFRDWDDVVFPQVFWTHTTARVLTMQRVGGLRLREVLPRLGPSSARRVAHRLAEVQMKMFITDQFFHADMHPGNVFFQPDGRIALLDVGMVGRMTNEQRDRFLSYWIAITRSQRDLAHFHLLQMAEATSGADLPGFRAAYERLLDVFYASTLAERSLARTYLEILLAGGRHGVVFPAAMILQAKAVVTAEALDLVLAPDFRFADEVRPIVARELAMRASPRALADRLWSGIADWLVLGSWPPTTSLPSAHTAEEASFRREALRGALAIWTDAFDARIRSLQTQLPTYLSGAYWREHAELQALVRTSAGLARQMLMTGGRLQEWATDEAAPPSRSKTPGSGPPEGSRATLEQTAALFEQHTAAYQSDGYWRDRQLTRASLTLAASLASMIATRLSRAIDERLNLRANADWLRPAARQQKESPAAPGHDR